MRRRLPKALAACLAFLLLPYLASGFGPPDWAEPFLARPTPRGPYIAARDPWVIVYGEVTIGSSGGHLEEHWRLLLENTGQFPAEFVWALNYDAGQDELVEAELAVQRTFWRKIAVEKKAVSATNSQGARTLLVSAENVEPGKRVALEYRLRDQLGFNPWRVVQLPLDEPAAELKVVASSGLSLELVSFSDQPLPASFRRESDGSFRISAVPKRERLSAASLVLQPTSDQLFPYFLAFRPGSPGESLAAYSSYYGSTWEKAAGDLQREEIRELAGKLVAGRNGFLQKVRALASFVQFHIQYDASTLRSVEGWLPRPTAEVLRSRRGDCKAKTLLLQALLASQGVVSTPVLLRSESSHFHWGQRPGSCFFNHVVLAIKPEGLEGTLPATLQSGPLAGWVLFDPKLETVSFGEPLPGYEGVPALAVGTFPEPRFTIATAQPSTASTAVEGTLTLRAPGDLTGTLKLTDNGQSPLVLALTAPLKPEDQRQAVTAALARRFPGARLTHLAVTGPAQSNSGKVEVELAFAASAGLSPVGEAQLLESPLSLAADFAGWAVTGSVLAAPSPEEVIEPGPPWEERRNCQGSARELAVTVELSLPPEWEVSSPTQRSREYPWLRWELAWRPISPGRWHGKLWLAQARGCWPSQQREEHLKSLTLLRKAVFAPLLLSPGPTPPANP